MHSDDELLAVRCQLGKPEAFDALVARWHPALWLYARRLTGNDDAADGAVQEVWLRVLRGLPGSPSRRGCGVLVLSDLTEACNDRLIRPARDSDTIPHARDPLLHGWLRPLPQRIVGLR